ncbi:DUF4011 domain-containing protein [Acinetobacter nosocomialis]|uniref:DUF4011 domain-containing protein n=1 Tax=Acinetobacter nosocomialis TaxID=106654 RepID=UPI001F318A94|nr:DUF4011 domain-containing protein [Acinetobacter nosocomialis]MCE7531891.1 DUF4011 domain-containing protein [Acinetobacter nosocomialis]
MNEAKTTFAYDSLESIRKRLLDTSSRNALLNYKFPRGKCIQFIETTPDFIFKALNDKKIIDLVPIPKPTEVDIRNYYGDGIKTSALSKEQEPSSEVWAKHLGFQTSFELVQSDSVYESDAIKNDYLQSLLYPKDLEARVKYIRQQAESYINETGSNVLYIAIGFLEWSESKDSNLKRLAPLFTLPVKVEKKAKAKQGGYDNFELSMLDEGILSNITLHEKLKNEFGLELPLIDEEVTPDEYFDLIEKNILKHQLGWSIKRKVCMCLLNFTKQAMYQDLDPMNWPVGYSIEDHPVLQQLFSKVAKESQSHSFDSEYEIDNLEDIHEKFPIIYDADSSQHSALIDAVKGENLVIEGPPGSGKSQTITNLIAAAINDGKKVLFVAEKMAALNVVKDRLDKAGLGGFCLELHSHKSNKLKILQDLIDQNYKFNTYAKPQQIQVTKKKLELSQSYLNQYVKVINKEWGETNLTANEILTKATYFKRHLHINPEDVLINDLDLVKLNQDQIHSYLDLANLLQKSFFQTRDQCIHNKIDKHYWYGVNKLNLIDSEKDEIIKSLKEWNIELEEIQKLLLENFLINDANSKLVEKIVHESSKIPDYDIEISYHQIKEIIDKRDVLSEYINLYERINSNYLNLIEVFNQNYLDNLDDFQIKSIKKIINDSVVVNRNITLFDIECSISKLEEIKDHLLSLKLDLDLIKKNIPHEFKYVFGYSENNFKEMEILLAHLKKLPSELLSRRSEFFEESSLDQFILSFEPIFNQLQKNYPDCQKNYEIEHLPSVEELEINYKNICIGGFFKYFTRRWWNAKKFIIGVSKNSNIPFIELQKEFPKLILLKKDMDTSDQLIKKYNIPRSIYEGVNTPLADIKLLRNWYKGIRNEYGVGFDDRVKIGSAILRLESHIFKSIIEEYDRKVFPKIKPLQNLFSEFRGLYGSKIKNLDNIHEILDSESEIYTTLNILKDLKSNFSVSIREKNIPLSKIEYMLDSFDLYSTELSKLSSIKNDYPMLYQEWKFDNLKGELNNLDLSRAKKTMGLLNVILELDDILRAKFSEISNEHSYIKLKNVLDEICVHSNNEKVSKSKFMDCSKAEKVWTDEVKNSFSSVLHRNELALRNEDWLFTWSNYYTIKNKAENSGFNNIVKMLEQGSLNGFDITDVVQLSLYSSLAKYIINSDILIQKYNGMELSANVENYQKYDNQLVALQRKQIASNAASVAVPSGVASGRVSDLTELSLIEKEASKKTRHIPIRSLLERAPNAIQALKPCFMMSPMSVAQYLKPGLFDFDLVVMDEASQILPEDAIGALARGKNAIIVGDPKQLPPTSFFSTSINLDEANEDELVGVEDAESILDSVSMFKKRRLRWHYRSRHQSLIAFSNKHFYDSDLVLFPSPIQSSPELGIRFKKVSGTFNSGRNCEEAQFVVEEVCEQILQDKDESIGIVAMNSQQRDEIEHQLELRLSQSSFLQELYDKKMKSHEPIFIKNLENVQGDERDVIVISMTYGPSQIGSKVFQRFGPINQASGWRRLNVLFTRSKKRMHIISSMSSSDILSSESSSKGVSALKAFLRYCETGFLHEEKVTGKAPDSDFEIAVMKALADYGYDCEPQLGVAGYFLDLAVKNPDNPGEYLMAIECDGATYHSAKSSRDRDRLRQQILESLGWNIHRIWSTDWFKNSQEQMQILLEKLQKIRPVIENHNIDSDIVLIKESTKSQY